MVRDLCYNKCLLAFLVVDYHSERCVTLYYACLFWGGGGDKLIKPKVITHSTIMNINTIRWFDLVLVVRADNKTLYDRLTARCVRFLFVFHPPIHSSIHPHTPQPIIHPSIHPSTHTHTHTHTGPSRQDGTTRFYHPRSHLSIPHTTPIPNRVS